ncbi:MAG: efflux RND transporter permease subunit, partial [Verrucomicrobiales bacterium]|nr:efflux RND transporter permease subunit [Verrucomicrobiales bacterium]
MRFTLTIAILLSILGIVAFSRMPRDIDPPDVIEAETVVAYLPGTAPENLDRAVTMPVERVLNAIPGIADVGTQTSDGISVVRFQLTKKADRAETLSIVRDRLGQLRSAMQLEMPFLIGPSLQIDSGEVRSGLLLATGGEAEARRKSAINLVQKLRRAPEISSAEITHDQPRCVVIRYDDEDLADAGLTPPELAEFIRANSQRFPGGYLSDGDKLLSIDLGTGIHDLESLRDLPVRDPRDGSLTPLDEICDITSEAWEPAIGGAFLGSQPAIGITFTKAEQATWGAVSRAVELATAEFPELQTTKILYRGETTSQLLSASTITLIFSAVAVLLCVTLGLGLRAGIAATVAIATTILTSVFLLHLLGYELNVITLSALAVGTGLLIDNHIVIAHHLGWLRSRHGSGEPRALAFRDLLSPLVIAAATTVLGFLPAWLLRGEPAGYVSSLLIVIGVLLFVSQVIGFTITPMLAPVSLKSNRVIDRLAEALKKSTTPLLAKPKGVMVCLALIVLLAAFLLKTGRESTLPVVPIDTVAIDLIFPDGTSPEQTETSVKTAIADSEVAAFLHFSPPRILQGMEAFAPSANRATLILPEDPGGLVVHPENATVRVRNISATPTSGDPIQFRMSGKDLAEVISKNRDAILNHVAEAGATTFGFGEAAESMAFQIQPDLETAAQQKVLTNEIAIATLAVTGGIPVGLIPDEHDPSNRLPVLLKVATDETDAEDRITEAYVHRQSGGNPVPLEDLAKVVRKSQPVAISRWN